MDFFPFLRIEGLRTHSYASVRVRAPRRAQRRAVEAHEWWERLRHPVGDHGHRAEHHADLQQWHRHVLRSAALIHSCHRARYRTTAKTPGRASRFGVDVFRSSVSKPDDAMLGLFFRPGSRRATIKHYMWRVHALLFSESRPVESFPQLVNAEHLVRATRVLPADRGEARAAARTFINNWCAMTSGLLQYHALDSRAMSQGHMVTFNCL